MISNLFLAAAIVIWGYVLKNKLRTKESFGPVLSIAVSMAVLEIGGAFGILWPVANIYCAAVCIYSIVYIARTRNKADMKAYFFNPAVVGFLFAVLFYMIWSFGKTLFYTGLDSFLPWGMFSKAVFYNHNFDIWNNGLSVNHKVYPHGMAAWYSLFALGKSVYSERDVMLSINALLFASGCPIVDIAVCRIRKLLPDKKIYFPIVYLVSVVSVAGFLWFWKFKGAEAYISGYMDVPLGVAFMAALCLAVTDSADYYYKALGVSLLSAMLVMIKPSGIIFVVAVCLVYLANEYTDKDFHTASGMTGKLFRGGMLVVSVPLLELGIWNIMMKYLDITGGDQFRLKEFLISNVIKRYQTDAAYAKSFSVVIRNFITAFFTRKVALHTSAFFWMILCIAIAVFTIILQKDRRVKKKVLYVNICMLLLFWAYNLFLLWTYLTTMSEGEALGTVCYDRYIGAYIIGWFVMCIYTLFVYDTGVLKAQCLYLGCFFLCNIWGFLNPNTYRIDITSEIRETYEVRNDIYESISGISSENSEDMPDLWVSYADEEASLNYNQIIQLKYYMFPDFDYITVYGTQADYEREMKDIIAEFSFDYVVFYGVNEDFYNAYYWYFADGLSNAAEQYKNGRCQAYKVVRDEATDEFCWFEPIL